MEPSIPHIVWNCPKTKPLRDMANSGQPIRMPADKAEERLFLSSIAERPQPCRPVEGRPPDNQAALRAAQGLFQPRVSVSPIIVAVDGGAGTHVGAWAVAFSIDQKCWKVAGDILAGEELHSFVAEIEAQRRALEALAFAALDERESYDDTAQLHTKFDEDKLYAVLWCGADSRRFQPKWCDVLVITDCLSAIAFTAQSVRASRDNIMQHKEIRQSLSILAKASLTIAIAWVPSHSKHRDWQAPLGFRHVAFRSANKVVDDRCTAVM